jgi:hypothetical protein
MAEKKSAKHAGVSDSAVRKATGRTWQQWFELLDRAGAEQLPHKAIAEFLDRETDNGWWAQMVALRYEQARGLRKLHQKADGFAASVSKTFNVSLDELYRACADARTRARWLHEKGVEITTATANKSLRMLWSDGKTRVDVNFYDKGDGKSQLNIQHRKLAGEKDVQQSKKTWKSALDELGQWLAKQG